MEYLDDRGEVLRRDSPSSLRETYVRYCAERGLAALNLGGEP